MPKISENIVKDSFGSVTVVTISGLMLYIEFPKNCIFLKVKKYVKVYVCKDTATHLKLSILKW